MLCLAPHRRHSQRHIPAASVAIGALAIAVLVASCSGGSHGANASAGPGTTYVLAIESLPIGIDDPLVTVAGPATARIVNNAIVPVVPVVTASIPNPQNSPPAGSVPVVCNAPTVAVTVQILQTWTLNRTTGDRLVRMTYPASLTGQLNSTTQTFSACSFVYATGDFIVYADQSAVPVDLSKAYANARGCPNTLALSVVANGDASRNVSANALLDTLFDSSAIVNGVFVPGPLCGGVWALSFAQGVPPALSRLAFSATIAPPATDLAADALNVYAIGTSIASRSYGVSFPDAACPIALTQPGASGSTCETIPGAAALLIYPGNDTSTAVYEPQLYLDGNSRPSLALQDVGSCAGAGACTGAPNLPAPALFAIDPSGAMATAITTDASGYPWNNSLGVSPVGAVDGWLLMGFEGGAPFSGLLWNPANGITLSVCGPFSLGTACDSTLVIGSTAFGMSICQRNFATPSLCGGTPAIGVLDVPTASLQNWNPVAAGWLPLDLVPVTPLLGAATVPLWFTDHVLFPACPATAGLNCPAPGWVSLDFASGVFTPVPGLPAGIAAQLVPGSQSLSSPEVRTGQRGQEGAARSARP